MTALLLLVLIAADPTNATQDMGSLYSDTCGDFYYRPPGVKGGTPGLVVLSCVGGSKSDIDTIRSVADSLHWAFAVCVAPRNRRSSLLNDADIVRVARNLVEREFVDPQRVFVFGFSGMGVQALASLCAHPGLLRGAAATCAHRGGISPTAIVGPRPGSSPVTEDVLLARLQGNKVFLRTRTEDWNRADNQLIYRLLREAGVEATLVTDSGPHSIGPKSELLEACRWLGRATAP